MSKCRNTCLLLFLDSLAADILQLSTKNQRKKSLVDIEKYKSHSFAKFDLTSDVLTLEDYQCQDTMLSSPSPSFMGCITRMILGWAYLFVSYTSEFKTSATLDI